MCMYKYTWTMQQRLLLGAQVELEELFAHLVPLDPSRGGWRTSAFGELSVPSRTSQAFRQVGFAHRQTGLHQLSPPLVRVRCLAPRVRQHLDSLAAQLQQSSERVACRTAGILKGIALMLINAQIERCKAIGKPLRTKLVGRRSGVNAC